MGVALLTHRFPACLGHFFHEVLGWIPDYRSPCPEPKLGKSKPYGYHVIFCSSRPCCWSELLMPVSGPAWNIQVPILRILGYYAQSRPSIRSTSKGLHMNRQTSVFFGFSYSLPTRNKRSHLPSSSQILTFYCIPRRSYIHYISYLRNDENSSCIYMLHVISSLSF